MLTNDEMSGWILLKVRSESKEIRMKRYDQAEVLVAFWKLGVGEERMSTSHGILDCALKECGDSLPRGFFASLSFGVTGVGLRCHELPAILLATQEIGLMSELSPEYELAVIKLDEDSARQIMISHGLSTQKAREIGTKLKTKVEEIRHRTTRQSA